MARLEDGKVPVEFIWLPSEAELPALKSFHQTKNLRDFQKALEKLKNFLKGIFNLQICIHDFKRKIKSDASKCLPSMFFAEYLLSVTCTIEHECNISDSAFSKVNLYKKLINKFCSRTNGSDRNELYLHIESSILIQDPLSTKDFFTDIDGFLLGNIVKLNKFVAHFDSEVYLKEYNYKITQTKITFLHDKEVLHLYFVVGNSKVHVKKRNAASHRRFLLKIPYSTLHTIIICHAKKFSVYFRLNKSPMLYAVKQDEDDENYKSYMSSDVEWERTVDLFEDCPPDIRKEFSMNSVLCLNFPKEDYEVLKIVLRHTGVQTYFAWMNVVPYKPVKLTLQISDFECYYGYKCLLTHSHELVDQLMDQEERFKFQDLMEKNSQEKTERCKVLSDILYKIYSAISKCNVVLLNYSIESLFEEMKSDFVCHTKTSAAENERSFLVKRAVVIPTHIRFLPPHLIRISRALESCDSEYSLRLIVRDVNMETIDSSYGGFNDERNAQLKDFFRTYFKKPLLYGIKIGKRHYNYVGSSTSQLRGHGLWFYAKDDTGKTSKMLRDSFGNMNKIKQVPKYMARMGQTFSQAMCSIPVPQKFTNVDNPEDDVKGGVKEYLTEDDLDFDKNLDFDKKRKFLTAENDTKADNNLEEEPYIFSDGIGRISLEIAEEVYKKLELEKERPAAMQIRYAGCKGMLVVDPRLKGKEILFRESMKKFSSPSDSLQIIKVSEKRRISLNRPLITILEQLGVSRNVFINLQKQMIQKHIQSMFYEPEACNFLKTYSRLRLDFSVMHDSGICFTEDPLFRSMIYAVFQKQLGLLKDKANIEIPENEGRAMFGVLDETFTLEYGQVFVQYTRFEKECKPEVVKGTVVVTKNPCMHPGDVRKFEAIDVKELHHICDCIVFPAKGPRPHPDEMAGSDLDGDEYHVMWYEDFKFVRDNTPPMHFAIPKDHSKDLERTITPDDELEHLCDYIVNDKVGVIASAHLAFADKEKKGIFSENCLRLAKKYSIALDFIKSGKTSPRHRKDIVHSYPDFMQKFGERTTYLSKKVLGVLFRNCKYLEMGLDSAYSEIAYELDPDLIDVNWNRFEKSAQRMHKYYCRRVEYLMNIYSFASEGELLAGVVINPPKYFEQRHDLEDFQIQVEYEVRWLFKDLRSKFFHEFLKEPDDNHFTEAMFQKASAWYMVAYKKKEEKSYNYFGLPWAVADVLAGLKQEKCRLKKNKAPNCKSLLEDAIDKSLSDRISVGLEETQVDVVYDNRLEILDVAENVLCKWLKTQEHHVLKENINQFRKLVLNEFQALSSILISCSQKYIGYLKETKNLKIAVSPAYYIIQTLLRLASVNQDTSVLERDTSFLEVRQELRILSWVTLIKLACTYNPGYLGIGEVTDSIHLLPHDNVVSTFKVYLFDTDEYNQQFSEKLLKNPEEVIRYLRNVSQIKDIDFRYDIEREHKYSAIFTVIGSRYATEKLKDLVVQEDFYMWVVRNTRLFAT